MTGYDGAKVDDLTSAVLAGRHRIDAVWRAGALNSAVARGALGQDAIGGGLVGAVRRLVQGDQVAGDLG